MYGVYGIGGCFHVDVPDIHIVFFGEGDGAAIWGSGGDFLELLGGVSVVKGWSEMNG
jgi:hypothetical protein